MFALRIFADGIWTYPEGLCDSLPLSPARTDWEPNLLASTSGVSKLVYNCDHHGRNLLMIADNQKAGLEHCLPTTMSTRFLTFRL